jgi:hypothetical protein
LKALVLNEFSFQNLDMKIREFKEKRNENPYLIMSLATQLSLTECILALYDEGRLTEDGKIAVETETKDGTSIMKKYNGCKIITDHIDFGVVLVR